MTLPDGWAALPFDAARGVPQSAPLPGAIPGLRLLIVAAAADLARLLTAPSDHIVYDSAERTTPVPAAAPPTPAAAHVLARRTALDAFTTAPPDSLSTAAVPALLMVADESGVHTTWPPLPGRALAVRGRGARLLGHLWVDALRLAAGSLVSATPCGSQIIIGWRAAPAEPAPTTPRPVPEDPYDGLV